MAATKTAKDEQKTASDAVTAQKLAIVEYEVKNASPGVKTGAIIGGIVVAGLLIGGCVYMKKKNSEEAEGGEMEDRQLFKAQFKGNTLKKVQKEALVPSFVIPAQEII